MWPWFVGLHSTVHVHSYQYNNAVDNSKFDISVCIIARHNASRSSSCCINYHVIMPRCACTGEVFGTVFVCLCVTVCVCVCVCVCVRVCA